MNSGWDDAVGWIFLGAMCHRDLLGSTVPLRYVHLRVLVKLNLSSIDDAMPGYGMWR